MMKKTLATMLLLPLLWVTSVEAGWDEGVAAFKAGNYAQAAKEFQTFVDERPDVFQGHYMLGQALSKLKRNQEALKHLQKAYDLEPGNVGIQLLLGKANLDVGRYSDAASILGKINVASLPANRQGALHQMLALAFEKTGNLGRATDELSKAARLSPDDANVQFQYGVAALKDGDTATALTALEKAARLDPSDAEKQRILAQAATRRGRETTGAAKGQAYQKASAAAMKVVAVDPSYDNLMLLAGAQLGAKQYDGALATLEQATAKNSGDWLGLYYLGQAQTQKSMFRDAERSLQTALNATTSSKDKLTVWRQLGFVYEKQKKYDQSIAAYQQANDSSSMQRVRDNQETAQYNQGVEAEAAEIERLRLEQEKIKKELQDLPGGPPPGS